MFIFTLLLWAGTFALSQILAPDPDIENAKAATLEDFNFPTATEGRVIPLGWGTDRIKGPNVLWYGDLKTIPITKKIKTSLFSSKKVVTGYRYYVGIQMGICLGPATLKKIWIGDELAWSGTQSTDGAINIDLPNAQGTFYFHTGSTTQAVNTYLSTFQSPQPAYRGMCYGVWQCGFVGDSPQVKPWAFEVERCPTGLGCTNPKINTSDANPMEVVYEILTNDRWGYGYPAVDIDDTEFKSVADTLYSEGNGFSHYMMNQRKAAEIIAEVEKQIDGRFRIDPSTGKWRCVLARDGYSTSGLRKAQVGNVLEVVDFSRGAWEGTINHVRVQYNRRANDYQTSYAPAQDGANMRIQGRTVPATYTFIGVKDDTLANKLAWRELRSNSYPFAKARLKVDRTWWDAYEGEVFLLDMTIRGLVIDELPMRITRINVGNLESPEITVDAVQDVFSWKAASFADPEATSWTAPVKTLIPFPSADQIAFEAPYAISRRDDYPAEGRVWCSGVSQNRGEIGFAMVQRNGSPPSGNFYDSGECEGLMFRGTVAVAVDQDATQIDITTDMNASELLAATATDIGNDLTNLILIGSEFVACTGASNITGGVRLTGCYRGLLDSAQAEHAIGENCYFIFVGGSLTDTAFAITDTVELKLLPFDFVGNQVSESDGGITVLSTTMNSRERRPYPPTFLKVAGTQYPTSTVSLDTQQGSGEDDKGIKIEWNRRDFRILDEVSQYSTDASTINGDFPSNNSTEYAVEVYKDPDTTPVLLFTTGWQNTATDYLDRSTILRYLDGAVPSKLEIRLKTRHTYSSVVYEAVQKIVDSFLTDSSELSGDHNFGTLSDLEVSTEWTSVPDTGTYACSIGTVNSGGPIEARINGGSWVTVIATSASAGNLTGVTAGDKIEIRSNGLTLSGRSETIFRMDSPTSAVDAYAIFVP